MNAETGNDAAQLSSCEYLFQIFWCSAGLVNIVSEQYVNQMWVLCQFEGLGGAAGERNVLGDGRN